MAAGTDTITSFGHSGRQQTTLLTIASELRNAICTEDGLAIKEVSVQIFDSDLAPQVLRTHPLLLVCRQLRGEAPSILAPISLVTARHYKVHMGAFHLEKLSQLSDRVLSQQAGFPNVELTGKQLELSITLGSTTERSLQDILENARTFRETLDEAYSLVPLR